MGDRKLKETNIKNCICYYLNGPIKINDLDFEKILLEKKLQKIILFIVLDKKFQMVLYIVLWNILTY